MCLCVLMLVFVFDCVPVCAIVCVLLRMIGCVSVRV